MSKIKNWLECSLDDVLIKLENGTRPKGGVRGIKEGVPSIGGEHLNDYGTFNIKNVKFVPIAFAEMMNRGKIQLNDILIVKDGATTGKVSFVDRDFPYELAFVNEHVFICRPSKEINAKYLFWYLWSDEGNRRILENFKGSAQGGINTTFITNTYIPLCPLEEQDRIVGILDTLFEQYYKSKSKMDNIPLVLKQFRHSILDRAVKGMLIESSDENWTEMSLDKVIVGGLKNGYSAKPVNYETDYRVLTLTATTSGKFNPRHFKYFDEEIDEKSHFWLKTNDIVVQRGNTLEYVGVPAIYDGEPNKFIYPDLMIKMRADETIISTKFLYYLLSAESSREYLRDNATGTSGNMPKINQTTLLSLRLRFPSLTVQKEIVTKAEELFLIADRFEIGFQKRLSEFERVPSTILNKAFTGKLNSNNANDSSVEGLLERIRTEKEAIKAEPKAVKHIRRVKEMNTNESLLKVISDKFKSEPFTFQELEKVVKMNYETLSANLLQLVSSENQDSQVIMNFNEKTNKIEFKKNQK